MDIVLARTIHVLAIVMWIGGVGFVTTVLFPAIRRTKRPEERLAGALRRDFPPVDNEDAVDGDVREAFGIVQGVGVRRDGLHADGVEGDDVGGQPRLQSAAIPEPGARGGE